MHSTNTFKTTSPSMHIGDTTMTNNTNTALTLHNINGEPRIHDLELGQRLGFSQDRDIRKRIKDHMAKLLTFGICATAAQNHGGGRGRPTEEFYLNRKQALFITMKSETNKAFEVQADIIRVYDAYLSGEMTTAPQFQVPQSMSEALRLAADLSEQVEQQQAQLQIQAPMVSQWQRFLDADGSCSTTSLVNALKIPGINSATAMHKALHRLGVVRRDGKRWSMTAAYVDKGWHHTRMGVNEKSKKSYTASVKWTPKGLDGIADLFDWES